MKRTQKHHKNWVQGPTREAYGKVTIKKLKIYKNLQIFFLSKESFYSTVNMFLFRFIHLKVEKDKNVLHIDAFNGVSHKGTLIFRGPGHQKD